MTSANRRRLATAATFAVLTATAIGPVLASGKNDDGEDRGTPMPLWWAIVLFGVVPLLVSAAISLIVLLPDWASRAHASTRGGYLDDPTLADRIALDRDSRAQIGQ